MKLLFFSFFRQSWSFAVYHDRFSDFEQELLQQVGSSCLMRSGLEELSGLMCPSPLYFQTERRPLSGQTQGRRESSSSENQRREISELQQKPAAHVRLPGAAVAVNDTILILDVSVNQ